VDDTTFSGTWNLSSSYSPSIVNLPQNHGPLMFTRLTDPAPLGRFLTANSPDPGYVTQGADPKLLTAVADFIKSVKAAGGFAVATSGFRKIEYQQHLREIRDLYVAFARMDPEAVMPTVGSPCTATAGRPQLNILDPLKLDDRTAKEKARICGATGSGGRWCLRPAWGPTIIGTKTLSSNLISSRSPSRLRSPSGTAGQQAIVSTATQV
jgi:hypothetical protein